MEPISSILDILRYRRAVKNDDAANDLINKYASNNPPQFRVDAEPVLKYDDKPILAGLPQQTTPIEGYIQRNNIIRDYARDLPLDASSNIAINNHYDTLEKATVKQYADDKKLNTDTKLLSQLYPAMSEYQKRMELAGTTPTAAGFFAENPQYTNITGYDKLNDNITKEIGVPFGESQLKGFYSGMANNARKTVQSPSEDLANSFDVLAKFALDPSKASPFVNRASEVTSDSFDKGGRVEDYTIQNGPVREVGQRFVTNRGAVTNLSNAEYNPEDAALKRSGQAIAREQLKYSKDNKDESVLLKLLEDIDKSDSLLVDLNSNLLDTIDAAKNPNGYVTEKDVLKARDNIAKAESTKISKLNAYGRRKWNVKQIPAGYNYDRDKDAFFNPNAPQGKRYWRP